MLRSVRTIFLGETKAAKGEIMSRQQLRVAGAAAFVFGVLLSSGALAQRYAPQESDGRGRTCSQIAKSCLQRGNAQWCDARKQECIQTGTWGGIQNVIRNLERR